MRTANPQRRVVVIVLGAAAVALAALASTLFAPQRDDDELPNILLISIDTLRADHLASYGYERDTAPALTALAARGAQFEQSYAQSPSTTPSHASMFTSRLPFQHGMFTYRQTLRDEEQTLAETLREHGYRTGAFASSRRFQPETRFDQGFDTYDTVYDLDKNERGARITDLVLEHAREAGSEPWFAFAHYFDPHAPYAPPEPYRTRWHPGVDHLAPEATTRFLHDHAPFDVVVPEETLTYLRGAYDGAISFADAHVARLLDGLEDGERPLLVVVTSDHGEEFKEHGYLGHSLYLHEELVRVPLLVAWPDVVPAGLRVAEPVSGIDLFPTILDLAGVPQPAGLVGRSFAERLRIGAPVLEESFPGYRDVVFLQQNHASWGVAATLESGRFKLVEQRTHAQLQLFRLDQDPRADRDVAAEYPDEAGALLELADLLGVYRAKKRGAQLKLTPEQEDAFRAMGYAGEDEE